MSERATAATQDLILEVLPKTMAGSSNERWLAVRELRAKADELIKEDLIDDLAIREISVGNAAHHNLDHEAADRVFGVRQKPSGGSLAAMHAPSRSVWQGNGACLTVTGTDVVHYINRPGHVEEIYGPALPYIVDKLGWMAIASDLKGHDSLSNRGGYQYVTNRLHWLGRPGFPHIGAKKILKDTVYHPSDDTPETLITSASGTLPTSWVDATYQRISEYTDRAVVDEAAGLFDGHIENRRAGLYDTMFGEMVGTLLYGGTLEDQMLEVFDPMYYEGVDIN